MSQLIERIVEISTENPELVSREIGEQVGCSEYYVRTIWQRLGIERSSGNRGIKPPMIVSRRVKLHKDTYYRIMREAGRRGVSIEAMLDGILEAVAQDNLFRAVLDD